MDKCKDGGFDEIFMTNIDYPAKYDYCIRYTVSYIYLCVCVSVYFGSSNILCNSNSNINIDIA